MEAPTKTGENCSASAKDASRSAAPKRARLLRGHKLTIVHKERKNTIFSWSLQMEFLFLGVFKYILINFYSFSYVDYIISVIASK